jgi:hypothetical protein
MLGKPLYINVLTRNRQYSSLPEAVARNVITVMDSMALLGHRLKVL